LNVDFDKSKRKDYYYCLYDFSLDDMFKSLRGERAKRASFEKDEHVDGVFWTVPEQKTRTKS